MKLSKQTKVTEIVVENSHIWLNLAQAYEAEISPYTHKKPDSNGQYPLDSDVTLSNRGYLIYHNSTPAGFSIIQTTNKNTHDICEFYICPHVRNHKLGKWFAHHLFDLHKGHWHVKQLININYATQFWRAVIRDYTGNNFTQHQYNHNYWGKVIEQRFSNYTDTPLTHPSESRLKKSRRLSIPRWQPRKQAQS
ncbi:hypothetical protein JD969_00910 [Planctomycetota bacterium]|nr:hypothetical protein JD969_00910 [Planctomycetota bacterium]